MGNRTLSTMKKNLDAYMAKFTPLFYTGCYYFALPTIALVGTLVVKPRAPFVDAGLEWLGVIAPKPVFNPMGMMMPPGMIMPG